jgi:hypothetical protein
MSSIGAAPRAAVPVSSARAEASRRNGAKSRGPKTAEGKARSAQNALKHGMRARKYLLLPEEDADEFAALEAAMIEELAPVGALRRCSLDGSHSPPGGSRGRTTSRSSCSRSAASGTAASGTPSFETAMGLVPSRHCCVSRRGDGGVLACPAHAEGTPGRTCRRHRRRPGGAPSERTPRGAHGTATARSLCATGLTRSPT